MNQRSRLNRCAGLLCVFLALAGTAYVARGLQQLILPHSMSQAKDLRTNWQEEQNFLRRISPYATSSPYPPWTFPANILFYWPGWPAVRIYWALINLAALAVVAFWAAHLARNETGPAGWMIWLSVPAVGVVSTGIGLGQNAIVYTAIVVVSIVLVERKQQIAGGALLAVAASKVSLSLPFFLPLLLKRRWKALGAAVAWIAGSWLLTSRIIRQGPLECLQSWVDDARQLSGVDYGPVSLLRHAGLNPTLVAPLWALVCLGSFVVAGVILRRLPLLTLYALSATIGRLWTYHRLYDDFMMVILLIACGEAWLRLRRPAALVGFLAVGATLWSPPALVDSYLVVQIGYVVTWITATVVLLVLEASTYRFDHRRLASHND